MTSRSKKIVFGVWNNQVLDNRNGLEKKDLFSSIADLHEFEPGNRITAIMGWDGFFVFDPDADVLDMVRSYMEVVQSESCGKCVPCQMGTKVAADILCSIADGNGREDDIVKLKQLCTVVKNGSMCELGHTSMNALSNFLKYYRDDLYKTVTTGKRHPRKTYHTKVTAPCIEACPERLDIPRYIHDIKTGRYRDSLSVIQEKNPLASVCGRVCVRFCEFSCRRGKLDDPVDIKHLKRFASDMEMDAAVKQQDLKVHLAPDAKRVAIIGAGPAGITAAYHLLLKGHHADIFEMMDEPGGWAAFGIPDYRLPREVLRSEAQLIQDMGAAIHYNQQLGRDFDLQTLRERGYEAIFIAIGCRLGAPMRIEGEEDQPAGYYHGVDFLKCVNRNEPIEIGDKIIVVGGGNVAMDCARSALRMGAGEVHLVYRRTRNEMPADYLEINEAEEEGVQYHFLTNPSRLIITDKVVTGVECITMEPGEPDESGRRRPVPVQGSEHIIDCDMVVPAIGQKVDLSSIGTESGLQTTQWDTIDADHETLQTGVDWIFAGGDCVTGPATLIEAMSAGFRVSNSIDQYFKEGIVTLTEDERMSFILRAVNKIDTDTLDRLGSGIDRITIPTRAVEERIDDFEEVEACICPEDALIEADRCLRCYRILTVATEI